MASTLIGGLAAAAPAFAQEAEETATRDTIQVTGTRVRNANLVAASPVTQVDAVEFELSGTTRVEDLLKTLPQVTPSLDAFTVNPSTGTASVNLRGLGTSRTLVLVNGRRLQAGGIRTEAPDLNQIPAALVQRVEILTGGASAVYGADAVAGVVNFIIDREFEGFQASAGISGYQHNNRNAYMQDLQTRAGFDFPEGSSGIDGITYDFDVAMGSAFDGGRGHASAYMTYRKNEEQFQGDRDYFSCALLSSGTACGGSSTAIVPNFLTIADLGAPGDSDEDLFFDFISFDNAGTWRVGQGDNYNYAPVNFLQRPDQRWTAGSFISYSVNPWFNPYLDIAYANTSTVVQIAETGTFFTDQLNLECTDPLINTLCADIGVNEDPAGPDISILVGKRNVEGGPRRSAIDSTAWRWALGTEGDLGGSWAYDASVAFAATSSFETTSNDFLRTRTRDALLGCPAGSFSGCIPYNPFVPGGVTPEAAAALAGTGVLTARTELLNVSGYVTGDLGVMPTSGEAISVVGGVEYRRESYRSESDSNVQTGNFTGRGGQTPNIEGEFNVYEVYGEAIIPILSGAQLAEELNLELGYRYSNYNTSGGASTYKILGSWMPIEEVRFRGGYNRAIRAPSIGELFQPVAGGLWGGTDPCAGPTPEFTAAQCANTGVTAGQYGNITANPADQNNQITGGNPSLAPESADTWTFGAVFEPLPGLDASIDYYYIEITDRIGTIGASNIVRGCALTGDPGLCSLVQRNPVSGDLWTGTAGEPGNGVVLNNSANFGNLIWNGIDFSASYATEAPIIGGNLAVAVNTSLSLEQTIDPLPGVNDAAKYDCTGVINPACSTPEWRHTARLNYDRGTWWTASLRWRRFGEMDYTLQNGAAGTQDRILVNNGNKLDAVNYFDVSAQFDLPRSARLTLGVNNVLDEEPPLVGAGLADNANSLTGYDQAGRYLFGTISVNY
ncbi:MAG: TonB-dependent receptor domain-containing protein [Oceanicaulis sp.]